MAKPNPYDAPKNVSTAASSPPRALAWSGVAVFASAGVGGLFGLGLGGAVGALMPGYYRSVFHHGQSPGFDPVVVGMGQGLGQGVVLGAVIGLALVALNYWYRSRLSRR